METMERKAIINERFINESQQNFNVQNSAEELAELTFRLLAGCNEKEDRLTKQYGLKPAEFRCLKQIHSNENVNNKEVAKRMHLSPSRLTRIIDGLVEKGFVQKEIEPKDRRNMRVSLTDKGRDFVSGLNNAYIDIHATLLKDIDANLHEGLLTGMRKLLVAVDKWISKS